MIAALLSKAACDKASGLGLERDDLHSRFM